MKLYFLALLISIVITITSAQAQECNASIAISNNDSLKIALSQPQKSNVTTSNDSGNIQMAVGQKTCNVILLKKFQVVEYDKDTLARFGVGKKEEAKQEMYNITISNNGDTRATNVSVSAVLDKGMKFESTRYYEVNRGKLGVTRDPIEFEEDTKTNLSWDISILEPEETKSIIFEVYLKPEVNNTNVSLNVTGEVGNCPINENRKKPEVETCVFNKDQRVCPDWSYPK